MATEQDIEAHLADLRARREAHWPKGVPRALSYRRAEQALTQYLRAEAAERPDAPMLHYYGRDLSWAEVDRLSDHFAGLLQARGLGAGARVALMMGNCPQFTILFLGIMKLGAILVPVNPMFKEHELSYQLKDSGAELIVAQDDLVPLVLSVQEETPLRAVLATGAAEMAGAQSAIPVPPGFGAAPAPEGVERLLPALEAAPRFAGPDFSDLAAPAALNYTGGTTGMPKGCVHTQGDMIYTAAAYCGATQPESAPGAVVVNFFPLFWIAGEDFGLISPLYMGATVCLLHRWDPLAFMAAVETLGAHSATLLVDNAVEVMRHERARAHDLTSLEHVAVCSFVKKLGKGFREEWRALTGTTMVEAAWGMTETNTCDTFTTGFQDEDYDLDQTPVFVGMPVPGTDFLIRDFETGALRPIGETGELCVRTPSLLKSYWNKPEATAESLRDGWLHTGDLGMINARGEVHYLGRRKEMLKVSGMPVFPAEIEMLIGRHPAVLGSGVIGRADERRGEMPVAFIRLDPDKGAGLDAEAMRAWCAEQMAVYKVPEIRLVDALPMTATGKVKKEELAKLL